jgi:hypothetical protein
MAAIEHSTELPTHVEEAIQADLPDILYQRN